MTLLQNPLVYQQCFLRSHAHTRMLTHSNMQTQTETHTYHDKVDKESAWDLERRRVIKKGESTDIKEMCLKIDTASFLSCTVTNVVHMCTSTLSGWKQHPLQSLCILLTAVKRTQRATSPARTQTEECREHRKDGEMGRYLTFSWGSQRRESRWAGLWLWWNLIEY